MYTFTLTTKARYKWTLVGFLSSVKGVSYSDLVELHLTQFFRRMLQYCEAPELFSGLQIFTPLLVSILSKLLL